MIEGAVDPDAVVGDVIEHPDLAADTLCQHDHASGRARRKSACGSDGVIRLVRHPSRRAGTRGPGHWKQEGAASGTDSWDGQ